MNKNNLKVGQKVIFEWLDTGTVTALVTEVREDEFVGRTISFSSYYGDAVVHNKLVEGSKEIYKYSDVEKLVVREATKEEIDTVNKNVSQRNEYAKNMIKSDVSSFIMQSVEFSSHLVEDNNKQLIEELTVIMTTSMSDPENEINEGVPCVAEWCQYLYPSDSNKDVEKYISKRYERASGSGCIVPETKLIYRFATPGRNSITGTVESGLNMDEENAVSEDIKDLIKRTVGVIRTQIKTK